MLELVPVAVLLKVKDMLGLFLEVLPLLLEGYCLVSAPLLFDQSLYLSLALFLHLALSLLFASFLLVPLLLLLELEGKPEDILLLLPNLLSHLPRNKSSNGGRVRDQSSFVAIMVPSD